MTRFERVQSPEQIAAVTRLAREIWQEHYLPIIGQAQVEYMLEKYQSESAVAEQLKDGYEYYLIAHEGQSAGYLAVVPQPGKQLLISKLYVRKSERGQGLGQAAVRFVEGLCRQRGIRTLWLTANKNNADSISWYLRMGFENAGPTVQDIGGGFVMDDFRFEKRFDRSEEPLEH